MKKYIVIIWLSLTMGLMSCDDYLDLVPRGESVLNTTDDYLGVVESLTPSYPMTSFWYMANEITYYKKADLESYLYPLYSIGFFWDESADRYNYTVDGDIADLYSECYSRIASYNVVVENMDDADGPESDKKLGIAQAKIMRAYNYFFLINTFAKPYKKETAATDMGIIVHKKFDLEAESKQYTVQEVYDFIEQDIKEALADLPDQALNSYRPTKSFGYALKAKVHLYKGEIDLALEAALNALKTNYHKLWNMNKMYEEAIANNPNLPSMPTLWGTTASFEDSDPEHLLYQFANTSTDPYPQYVRKEVIDLYDKNNDLRYITCWAYYMPARPTAETGCVMFGSTKVKWNPGGMRLSEVYLMIAECYARKGDKDNAMKYLNDLYRNRVKTGTPELIASDADEAFKLIREERKRELVLTYNGFFDMRRFCTEFNETLTKTYVNEAGETKVYTLKPDSPLLVWPFPAKAMETSDLVQNTK